MSEMLILSDVLSVIVVFGPRLEQIIIQGFVFASQSLEVQLDLELVLWYHVLVPVRPFAWWYIDIIP